MNIESEAKNVATSIIDWCFLKDERDDDENYPTHLVENLLKRQKQDYNEKLKDIMNRLMLDTKDKAEIIKAMEE